MPAEIRVLFNLIGSGCQNGGITKSSTKVLEKY